MKEDQLRKLDKCYFKYNIEQRCEEMVIPARQLLGSSRFDIYAILVYIDHRVRGVNDLTYAKYIYKERTRAITGLEFFEEGNKKKNTIDAFFSVLDKLIEDFKNGKYDENRTLIPVDKDYELIDGAHRVSCAAYFGKNVRILRFLDEKVSRMTYSYLLDKFLPQRVADAMALEAAHWHDDLFVLILWPKSFLDVKKHNTAEKFIYEKLDVLYKKHTIMTYQAIRNLMIQMYGHMDWVGNIENDFHSTYSKADEVWSKEGRCDFFLVKAPSTEYVLNIKSQVREIFQIGLASIHSTDNKRETNIVVNAIFNPNTFHFLRIASPTKYKKSYNLLQRYKQAIQKAGLSIDDFIVDSSMVLSIVGAREANDLDYYTLLNKHESLFEENKRIEEHDDTQKQFYNIPVRDLILSPQNHFYYDEIKFVSLEQLLSFKHNRFKKNNDSKDSADIKILEMILSGKEDKWAIKILAIKVEFKRFRHKTIRRYYKTRTLVLKKTGLYGLLKKIRDIIRKA